MAWKNDCNKTTDNCCKTGEISKKCWRLFYTVNIFWGRYAKNKANNGISNEAAFKNRPWKNFFHSRNRKGCFFFKWNSILFDILGKDAIFQNGYMGQPLCQIKLFLLLFLKKWLYCQLLLFFYDKNFWKNAVILSKGMISIWSYKSVCTASAISISSLLSPFSIA